MATRRRKNPTVPLTGGMNEDDRLLFLLVMAVRDFAAKQNVSTYRTLAAAMHDAETKQLDIYLSKKGRP